MDHYHYEHVWISIAKMGSVQLLEYMLDHGLSKNSTDRNGVSILGHVVGSGNIEAARYLLDLGVTVPTYTKDVSTTQCAQCKEQTLIVDGILSKEQINMNPLFRAICDLFVLFSSIFHLPFHPNLCRWFI